MFKINHTTTKLDGGFANCEEFFLIQKKITKINDGKK